MTAELPPGFIKDTTPSAAASLPPGFVKDTALLSGNAGQPEIFGAGDLDPLAGSEPGTDPRNQVGQSVFGPVTTPGPYSGQKLIQGPPSELEAIDDFARTLADQPFITEVTAALYAAAGAGEGESFGERYENIMAAESTREAEIEERIGSGAVTAIKIAGGVAMGGALAKGGLTLMSGAKPTLTSLGGRGAAEGAAYGAAYGASEGEGLEGRLEGAARGAGTGALAGGLAGAFFWPFLRRSGAKAVTADDVKDASQAAFRQAEKAGLEVTADSFSSAVDDIAATVRKAGIDSQIHPKATAVLQRLQSETAENLTLDSLTTLRRVAKGAAASPDPDERRIAMIIVDELDKYAERLLPRDIVAGDRKLAIAALKKGRTLWSRYRKGEAIMEAIDRAGVRAGQFSGSGYENALRTEFRAIAMNRKKMRTYTKAEQETIRKVAMGGPVETAMRWLGKLAPTNVVSMAVGGGMGAMIGGTAGAIGLPMAGLAGRQAVTALTKASTQRALNQMLSGTGPVTITRKQADLLRSLIIGEQAALSE